MDSEDISRLQPWAYSICVLWLAGRSVGDISKAMRHTPGTIRGIIHRRIQPSRQEMSIAQRQLQLELMKEIRRDGGLMPDRFFVAKPVKDAPVAPKKAEEPAPNPKTSAGRKEISRLKKEEEKRKADLQEKKAQRELGGATRRGANAAALESILPSLADSGEQAKGDMDPKRIPSGARRYQAGVQLRTLIDGCRLGGLGSVDYERSGGGGGTAVPMSVYRLQCIHNIGAIRDSIPPEEYAILEAVVDRDEFPWETKAGIKARAEIINSLRRSLDVVGVQENLMTIEDFRMRWGVNITNRRRYEPTKKPIKRTKQGETI